MTTTIDLTAVKQQQRIGWQTANYARVGNTLQIMAEHLVDAVDVHAGQRVLDIACGQGNAAIAAALRFADATGVDYAPNLLEQARARAAVLHLDPASAEFVEGDAEDLPFEAATFDAVLSTVGVMFAPDHARSAAEAARVLRSGGRIGLASWTPSGMIGDLFRIVARYAPPPAGVQPAALWGTPDHLRDIFGTTVSWTSLTVRQYAFHFLTPEHYADYLCQWYGPTARLSAGLDEARRTAFHRDLAELAATYNRATDGTVAAVADYLEAVGTRT
jgi:ubiquinone/menaquinone biosynthesis C-methylase UbiE